MTEKEQLLHKAAFDWWNFDKLPPKELWTEDFLAELIDYIHNHPEWFKGEKPQ